MTTAHRDAFARVLIGRTTPVPEEPVVSPCQWCGRERKQGGNGRVQSNYCTDHKKYAKQMGWLDPPITTKETT